MTLTMTLTIGLLAAFLMFMADIILYYDPVDYQDEEGISGIITIMKDVSKGRLYLGGILGVFAAFLYCVGQYHMLLISDESYLSLAWLVYLINSLGMIAGGAYHSQWAYLGLLSRYQDNGFFDEVLKYMKFQVKIVFGTMVVGSIGLALMIVLGYTIFPRWMVLFTPLVLILLTPLVNRLPRGLHIIVRGGWTNLMYFIYYLTALIDTLVK